MSEKVVLTRQVAEALDHAKSTLSNEEIIKYHANDSDCWNNKAQSLNGLPLMTLMSALVNEYEVEKSSEEKIRYYYEQLIVGRDTCRKYPSVSSQCELRYEYQLRTVRHTLNLLGITIEGINGAND